MSPINNLTAFYTCYNEKRAIEFSINKLRQVYPFIPIFLVSEKEDFGYLKEDYNNITIMQDVDTLSDTFKVTDKNFLQEDHQNTIKKCTLRTLHRLNTCINKYNPKYIIMMDPDSLVRGPLNIPDGIELLGSKINKNLPTGYRDVLFSIPGAKVINEWGATPGIFKCESFLKAYQYVQNNPSILDRLIKEFYAVYAHDLLLPTLFALIGKEETFNPDIVECGRNHNWKNTHHPLVHQFRDYYE